ncbi:MAG: methyltransferase domain-containing protein [Gemmatimonadaceae bacterium]|nr:methyltransferase domain-containing protein [Gemmatimonadaceae bacterium]NUQ91443.1 methyltransferase domain-containing protein [Gemmatimonadaceae bacterium]NUR20281.1 methyltransferase domain-containing protein [Gemmatimonadaceae bacterium]NUS95970.1 methyltransferase domain-containing protein [Gemmatimonadaceae bacterium]
MTAFEMAYRCAEPFLPPLYASVRRQLLAITGPDERPRELLDVGGRKSHYTIGVPANVTISELPRETETQVALGLGVTEEMVARTRDRRSNVRAIVLDDMTRSALPDASFDLAVAVEVLEHVEEDALFVREVARVLRPGGVFLMTTPNGDTTPKPHNADHKRHYTRAQLRELLSSVFPDVHVEYAVVGSRFRRAGLKSWSVRHPLRTVASMGANVINRLESARPDVPARAIGTRHLIARAVRGR